MQNIKTVFSAFLLFLPAIFWAQVVFKGELKMGDTTQVHILNLKDGSRLVGRVVGFDEQKLTFLFGNANRLEVPAAEVLNVEVQGSESPVSTANSSGPQPLEENAQELTGPGFKYLIHSKKGNKITGQIVRLTTETVNFINSKGIEDPIAWGKVDSFELISERFTESKDPVERLQVLKTQRGDRFVGQLIGYSDGKVSFLLENNIVLRFRVKELAYLRMGEKATDKHLYTAGNNGAIFFSPTGFRLKKGETVYKNTMILYNTMDYGVNDNLTVGGSVSTLVFVSSFLARLKFGYDIGDFAHIAVGGQAGGAFVIGNTPVGVALGYGAISLGTADRYINFSAGSGRSNEGDPTKGFSFGSSIKLSDNWRVMAEYLNFQPEFDDNVILAFAGASWHSKKSCFDFGFTLVPTGSDDLFPLPTAAYSYKF